MNSQSQATLTVSTKGQPDLTRTVADCYAMIARTSGTDSADLWLLNLDTKGTATIWRGVDITFTVKVI